MVLLTRGALSRAERIPPPRPQSPLNSVNPIQNRTRSRVTQSHDEKTHPVTGMTSPPPNPNPNAAGFVQRFVLHCYCLYYFRTVINKIVPEQPNNISVAAGIARRRRNV